MSDVKTHTTWRDEMVDEVRAIEIELGTTPSGASSTVAARFTAVEADVAALETATTPNVNATRLVTQSHTSNGSFIDLAFNVEAADSDGFHAGSTGVFVVPVGLGGHYIMTAGVDFASNATGIRSLACLITGNTGRTNEVTDVTQTGAAHATAGVSLSFAKELTLEAGATLTFRVYQNSGGNLDIDGAYATLRMTQAVPAWT